MQLRQLLLGFAATMFTIGGAAGLLVLFQMGWYEFQIVMRFVALIGIATGAFAGWMSRRKQPKTIGE
jgi:hypothetical protein